MIETSLRELLEAAAEAGARRALEAVAEQAPGVLVPIREAGVSHRALLAAAKAGEIQIHRRGKAAFVERAELERWIVAGSRTVKPADPVAEFIDITHQRRRRRAG